MKRNTNENKKKGRARSFAAGQTRKEQNRTENEAAAKRNRELREQGALTPWEEKRARRAARRNGDPLVQARRVEWEKRGGAPAPLPTSGNLPAFEVAVRENRRRFGFINDQQESNR